MTASHSARRRMTVAEFLAWDSGDDRHYELRAGAIVAMNPPSAAHRIIQANLTWLIAGKLRSTPPCSVQGNAGIVLPDSDCDYYEADLAVTCVPHRPGQQDLPEPVLIIEVLSPSTASQDRAAKLPEYQRIASLREIVLVEQDRPRAEAHRRQSPDRWRLERVQGLDAVLRLDSIGLDLPMAEVYRGVALEG